MTGVMEMVPDTIKRIIDVDIIVIYTMINGGTEMDVAKIFANGRSQAVRLPKEYRLQGDEVFINRIGDMIVLLPKDKAQEYYWTGLAGLGDLMSEGRADELESERIAL